MARWSGVDRLLEKRSVERIGLVEQGEHAEPSADQQSFQGHFVARDELLYQVLLRVTGLQNGPEATHRRNERLLIVGADDATAGAETQPLDDTRECDRRCEGLLALADRVPGEGRDGNASPGEHGSLEVFVSSGA